MALVVIADCGYENIDVERKLIEGEGHELRYYHCKTEDDVIECASEADVLIVQFAPVTRRVIEKLHKCKLICRYAIGVDIIDIEAATEHEIFVANVPDYCIDEVSNHAIALLMSLARKIPLISNSVKEGKWDYTVAKPLHRMLGSKLGIIGYGRIGSLVARKLNNFGMDVITCDPWIRAEISQQDRVRKVDMDTLLSTSDFISIHVPLTKDTRHLLSDEQFGKMKKGVTIVNTARGPVIDEQALIRALESGIVSGAALDVMEKEPLSLDSPLRKMPNVILTPHFAWYSDESIKLLQRSVAEEALRVLRGELPKNLVNSGILRVK